MQYLAHVPMDDEHSMLIRTDKKEFAHFDPVHLPNTDDWYGRFRPIANRENGYLLDREAQRTGKSYTRHRAEASRSRTRRSSRAWARSSTAREEHLVSSDTTIVRFRKRMIECAFASRTAFPLPASTTRSSGRTSRPAPLLPDDLSLTEVADRLHEMQGQRKQDWVPSSTKRFPRPRRFPRNEHAHILRRGEASEIRRSAAPGCIHREPSVRGENPCPGIRPNLSPSWLETCQPAPGFLVHLRKQVRHDPAFHVRLDYLT